MISKEDHVKWKRRTVRMLYSGYLANVAKETMKNTYKMNSFSGHSLYSFSI